MLEDYRIVSPPRGEPRAAGAVGVRVRIRLSGAPSRRWSRDMGARLTRELVGHPGAAHLRMKLDDLVQGDEIVLDGVEDHDASGLATALRRAVDAANDHAEQADPTPNISQGEADALASHIPIGEPAGEGLPCPRCGRPLALSAGDQAAGDQLALSQIDCPGCGARLARDVQGHADHGWRMAAD
jgi:hypothetical protein